MTKARPFMIMLLLMLAVGTTDSTRVLCEANIYISPSGTLVREAEIGGVTTIEFTVQATGGDLTEVIAEVTGSYMFLGVQNQTTQILGNIAKNQTKRLSLIIDVPQNAYMGTIYGRLTITGTDKTTQQTKEESVELEINLVKYSERSIGITPNRNIYIEILQGKKYTVYVHNIFRDYVSLSVSGQRHTLTLNNIIRVDQGQLEITLENIRSIGNVPGLYEAYLRIKARGEAVITVDPAGVILGRLEVPRRIDIQVPRGIKNYRKEIQIKNYTNQTISLDPLEAHGFTYAEAIGGYPPVETGYLGYTTGETWPQEKIVTITQPTTIELVPGQTAHATLNITVPYRIRAPQILSGTIVVPYRTNNNDFYSESIDVSIEVLAVDLIPDPETYELEASAINPRGEPVKITGTTPVNLEAGSILKISVENLPPGLPLRSVIYIDGDIDGINIPQDQWSWDTSDATLILKERGTYDIKVRERRDNRLKLDLPLIVVRGTYVEGQTAQGIVIKRNYPGRIKPGQQVTFTITENGVPLTGKQVTLTGQSSIPDEYIQTITGITDSNGNWTTPKLTIPGNYQLIVRDETLNKDITETFTVEKWGARITAPTTIDNRTQTLTFQITTPQGAPEPRGSFTILRDGQPIPGAIDLPIVGKTFMWRPTHSLQPGTYTWNIRLENYKIESITPESVVYTPKYILEPDEDTYKADKDRVTIEIGLTDQFGSPISGEGLILTIADENGDIIKQESTATDTYRFTINTEKLEQGTNELTATLYMSSDTQRTSPLATTKITIEKPVSYIKYYVVILILAIIFGVLIYLATTKKQPPIPVPRALPKPPTPQTPKVSIEPSPPTPEPEPERSEYIQSILERQAVEEAAKHQKQGPTTT